ARGLREQELEKSSEVQRLRQQLEAAQESLQEQREIQNIVVNECCSEIVDLRRRE
ncbi:unnamed protein product, partial [Symbiodinium sp. CCMP2592]